MGQQAIRQRARRTAREMADRRRRERAERERRVMELAEEVMVAIGERDEVVAATEQRAAQALRSLTQVEGLSLSEAAAWCGDTLSVGEARRIRDLPDTQLPDTQLPDTNQPDTNLSGTNLSGTGRPHAGRPDTGLSESDTHRPAAAPTLETGGAR